MPIAYIAFELAVIFMNLQALWIVISTYVYFCIFFFEFF